MKAWIVYDSVYGNTEKIAQAIQNGLGSAQEVALLRVSEAKVDQLAGVKLLIVGSPTQRFQPLLPITTWLDGIPENGLKGVKVAVFDTRLTRSNIEKTPALAFFVKLFGKSAYAAKRIEDRLKKKGGGLSVPAEGFFVAGTEGPLVAGELERAAEWAKQIKAKLAQA